MKIRRLKIKDAPYMLEWMRDESVIKHLQAKFSDKTLRDCEDFIRDSWGDSANLHMAVVDDCDSYMGTVSMKHLNDKQGEFAIAMRKIAMGFNYGSYGMKSLLEIARKQYGITKAFWYVSCKNLRALRFYDKHGYRKRNEQPDQDGMIWYEHDLR